MLLLAAIVSSPITSLMRVRNPTQLDASKIFDRDPFATIEYASVALTSTSLSSCRAVTRKSHERSECDFERIFILARIRAFHKPATFASCCWIELMRIERIVLGGA